MLEYALLHIPAFATSVVAFLFSVGLLIVIHEWGHYIMAKRGGVPVEEFAIGFGPLLARLGTRGETTFNLRLIPVGGYVRMAGMEPGDDVPNGYNTKPLSTRLKIVSAGVVVNLLFGFLLFVVLGLTVGMPVEDPTSLHVAGVEPGSPAAVAGMRAGDLIVRLDGVAVTTPKALTDAIRSHPSAKVALTLRRGTKELTVPAVPAPKTEDGKVIGRLGFEVGPGLNWQRQGLVSSVTIGAERSWLLATGILRTIFSKVTWKERQLGGPIAIAQQAGTQAEQGARYLFMFIALLSINLGVLNILPIPALDGGHILLLGVEALRGRKLQASTAMWIQGLGFAILLMFIFYATGSDLMRIFSRG